jgi:hypothetical protein
MMYDRIIKSLVEIQNSIKEKMGNDGKPTQRPSFKDGPGGYDRIQYEIGIISDLLRHIPPGNNIPDPPETGTAVLKSVDGIIQWTEEDQE